MRLLLIAAVLAALWWAHSDQRAMAVCMERFSYDSCHEALH